MGSTLCRITLQHLHTSLLMLLLAACNHSPVALATNSHQMNSLSALLWAALVKVQCGTDDGTANTVLWAAAAQVQNTEYRIQLWKHTWHPLTKDSCRSGATIST